MAGCVDVRYIAFVRFFDTACLFGAAHARQPAVQGRVGTSHTHTRTHIYTHTHMWVPAARCLHSLCLALYLQG
jgi:hypothetical protein